MTDRPSSPDVDLTKVAAELRLKPEQVRQTVQLLDEGNTVPFITRYPEGAHGESRRGADSGH
jgi:transcriptional accessory protein Tex/SPT6